MADWIFNVNGDATIILNDVCLRNSYGNVIAWINYNNVYSLDGNHIGWFERGILYDSNNEVLGFIRNRTGHLPSIPGIGATPGMPGFSGRPGIPGLSGVPGRPGYGGWSNRNLATYFN